MEKKTMNLPEAERMAAVQTYLKGDMSREQVLHTWGISARTLRRWVQLNREGNLPVAKPEVDHYAEPEGQVSIAEPKDEPAEQPRKLKSVDQTLVLSNIMALHPEGLDGYLSGFAETMMNKSMGHRSGMNLLFNNFLPPSNVQPNSSIQEAAELIKRMCRILTYATAGAPVRVKFMPGNPNDAAVQKVLNGTPYIHLLDIADELVLTSNSDNFARVAIGSSHLVSRERNVVTDADLIRAHTDVRERAAQYHNYAAASSVVFANPGRQSSINGTRAAVGCAFEGSDQLHITLHRDGSMDRQLLAMRKSEKRLPDLPANAKK